MIDITFEPNGLDLSRSLSTYGVSLAVTYKKIITTMDDTEHAFAGKRRRIIRFSLIPMTEEESTEVYNTLAPLEFDVRFFDPHSNRVTTRRCRLTTDLDAAFLLKSVDGKRRYRGAEIQLREV